MIYLTLLSILILVVGALLPSTMSYGVTTFLNGMCIFGACVLSYNLGKIQ
jgi:hypothetical protein